MRLACATPANLAWKLALVLDGKADDQILDTYQVERLPHVSQITDMAIFLGKMICIPDPEAAAERDRTFLGGNAPPMRTVSAADRRPALPAGWG